MRLQNDMLERLLGSTAALLIRHPKMILAAYIILVAAGGLISWNWLAFDTDQNNLISNDQEYNRRYLEFMNEFGDLEYLYVVIEVRDLARAMKIADRVAAEVSRLREHVQEVFHRVPEDFLRKNGLLFMPEEALRAAAAFLKEHEEVARRLLSIRGLDGLLEFIHRHLNAKAAAADPQLAGLGLELLKKLFAGMESAAVDEVVEAIGGDWLSRLSQLPDEEPWKSLLGQEPLKNWLDREALSQAAGQGYLYTGKLLFVEILPVKNYQTLEVIREPLQAIRKVLDGIKAEFPQDRIGLTGRPVLQADEMETTNNDMTLATLLAILGVLLFFMIFFRAMRRPILTGLVILVAIAITFGIVTVTIGHLNLLSIVFAVMLVSLGMEFGIHLIARYQEELHSTGGDIEAALRNALLTAGKGNITGATTTAAAFYTTLFVDFKGLAELGFIAGTGVLVCLISMSTLLPVLLLLTDRWRLPRGKLAPIQFNFLGAAAARPGWTLLASVALLLSGLWLVGLVRFDANLLKLQAEKLESVQFENLIIEKSDFSTWYSAHIAGSREEVRRLVEKLLQKRQAGVVGKIESILDYIPENQAEKIAWLRQLGPLAREAADRQAVPPAGVDAASLKGAVEKLLDRLDSLASGALRQQPEAVTLLEGLTNSLDRINDALERNPEKAARGLGKLQAAWWGSYGAALQVLSGMFNAEPLAVENLPAVIRNRVLSKTGKYLVYAFPKENIWHEQNMERFIQATREVDPLVTGVPEQVYESTRLMKKGFLLAALYSLIAVFLLIWIDFKNLLFTLLALVPIVLGMLWLLELMPLFDMAFNLANFFAIPIIIGCGVDGGVHIIHRFREDRSAAVATRSTGTAVVLSFLTTIIGFGMMMLARHRGVASLGALMVLGCLTCLFSSIVVLPAILKLVERRRYHGVR